MLDLPASPSPVILFVLVVLVVFSLVSWTILVWKAFQLAQIRAANRQFQGFLEGTTGADLDQRVPDSPLAALHRGALAEQPLGLDQMARTLRKVSTVEIERLERGTGFLATTAAATPFIGLFGTVWGIMTAFQRIGEAGSTSLAIVSPGISEALVTTAVGLAVAIPAVMGYNFLQGRVRRLTAEIDNESYDLLNAAHRAAQDRG
jgi:biopolymer transport protein TolQ